MARISASRGWIVALAGLGINLALGVLYAWSVIAKSLTKDWGWSAGEASLPYATAVGVFALSMVFAGRAQDRFGPRIVASVGGALTGAGMLVASLSSVDNSMPILVGFGLMAGAGIGLGYAAATPAAVKWFPPARKGLITGIVVSGFGLASVYIAPLTSWLLTQYGTPMTFRILGGVFLVATVALAQLLVNPPEHHLSGRNVAAESLAPIAVSAAPDAEPEPTDGGPPAISHDYDWREMVRTRQFALLWVMYAFASFAGLMIIGHMAKIAAVQLTGIELGFVLVAVLAVGNAAGRIVAGMVSDAIGGTRTMLVVFTLQAVMMVALAFSAVPLALVPVAAGVGFCYGANLSLFPSTTASYFGTAHLGVNYGLVFTAWGVGGVFGSMTAGTIVDSTGSYAIAYGVAALLCLFAAGLSLTIRPPSPRTAVAILTCPAASEETDTPKSSAHDRSAA